MESHEILREAFQQTSPKEIAAEMGLSLSLVYKWAQPGEGKGSGVDNPLDRVMQLVRLTQNPRLMEWLCQKAGGYYVRNPSYQRCDDQPDVFPATNEIIQEFADLLESITIAAADRTISVRESEKIRQQWDELKAFTEGFVRCCEEGNFEKPKHQHDQLRACRCPDEPGRPAALSARGVREDTSDCLASGRRPPG